MASETDQGMPRRLLVVHHTPSPGMQAMLESVLAGCTELGAVLAATLMPDA